VIRPYQETDLDDLMATWEAASALAHPFLSEAFQAQVRRDIPKVYLPMAETWVAEQGDRVVGFLALIGHEVGALFVQPSHHGQGLGRALMDTARGQRTRLEVEVFEDNAIGRAFYDRYGFTPLSESIHEPTGCAVLRLEFAGAGAG
jgi:putative acetyltransferase